MNNMNRLLDALADCGEAAAFYKGTDIVAVNQLFADMFGRKKEELENIPVIEICHQESVDMITDFMRRRAHGDVDVPTTYLATFRSQENPSMQLRVTVIKTRKTESAMLVIAEKV